MIIKKSWRRVDYKNRLRHDYTGWFILGILPVYIKRGTVEL
jgi:hypothetical protein